MTRPKAAEGIGRLRQKHPPSQAEEPRRQAGWCLRRASTQSASAASRVRPQKAHDDEKPVTQSHGRRRVERAQATRAYLAMTRSAATPRWTLMPASPPGAAGVNAEAVPSRAATNRFADEREAAALQMRRRGRFRRAEEASQFLRHSPPEMTEEGRSRRHSAGEAGGRCVQPDGSCGSREASAAWSRRRDKMRLTLDVFA